MIKKLLLTTMLGVAAMTASAETQLVEFSYAQLPCNLWSYGSAAAEEIGAAIGVAQPAFAGMKLIKIDAYLNADASTLKNFKDTKLFISTELDQNKPNVMLTDVTPTVTSFSGESGLSVMSYQLDEPYVLGSDPFYVGYFLTVTKVEGEGERHPILLDRNISNPGAFFFRSNATTDGQWTNNFYTSGAVTIFLTLERDAEQYAVGINSTQTTYAKKGEDFYSTINITNIGTKAFSTMSYKYSIDGGDEQTGEYTFSAPVAPQIENSYNARILFSGVEDPGEHVVDFEITALDGNAVSNGSAAAYFELDVLYFEPKSRPLVEEYTGMWCGYCPRGITGMEYLSEEYPHEAIILCYHNNLQGNDPLTVTNTNPMGTNSFPGSSINRVSVIDPYYGSPVNGNWVDLGIENDFRAALEEVCLADIDVTATVENGLVTANTTVTFAKNVTGGTYRIGYVLTCNDLYNENWSQSNYFARQADLKGTPLEIWAKYPSVVYGLTFQDVVVNVDGMNGVAQSIPTNVAAEEPVNHTFTMDVSNNKIINDLENVVVNAFLVDYSSRRVVNANRFRLKEYLGVNGVDAESSAVVSTEYYDLTGRRVVNPDNGIFIRSEKLENGSVKTTKVVK